MTYVDVLARTVPSDAELITAVRVGDTAAFATLYERHVDATRRLACSLTHDRAEAEDLIAETFARIFGMLREDRGPTEAFRTYLLSSLRHLHVDRIRKNSKLAFTDDLSNVDPGTPFVDTAVEELDRGLAARAFARLPERQQMVLWHTEVEGETPAAIAPLLGMTPNGVAALAYRARERLRQAYLREYMSTIEGDEHEWVLDRLPTRVRGSLPAREEEQVAEHLDSCEKCRALYAELGSVNSGLRALLLPVVLGPAGAAYLTTLPTLAGGGLIGTVTSWFNKVPQNGGAVSAAGVGGALVAAVAAVALGVTSPDEPSISPSAGLDTPRISILSPAPQSEAPPSASPTPSPSVSPTPSPEAEEPPPPPPTDAPSPPRRPASPSPTPSEPAFTVPSVVTPPAPEPSVEPSAQPTPEPSPTPSPSASESPTPSRSEPSPTTLPPPTLDMELQVSPRADSEIARVAITVTGVEADELRIVVVLPDGSAAAVLTPETFWGNCATVVNELTCEFVGRQPARGVVKGTLLFAPPPGGGNVTVIAASGETTRTGVVPVS